MGELVGNRVLDVDVVGIYVDLFLVHECFVGGGVYCVVEVDVVEYDEWILFGQLEYHLFEVAVGCLC